MSGVTKLGQLADRILDLHGWTVLAVVGLTGLGAALALALNQFAGRL